MDLELGGGGGGGGVIGVATSPLNSLVIMIK